MHRLTSIEQYPFPTTRGRICLALIVALAAGCGDDAGGPTGGFPPGAVPPTAAGGAPNGMTVGPATPAIPPVLAPLNPGSGNSSVDGGVGVDKPQPTAGNADTQWCKVKAILDKNCTACHQTPATGGAPFPLTTHAELMAASPKMPAKKIYERVAVRASAQKSQDEGLGVMPPGRQLDAADRSAIDAWVAAGAPAGQDPTCAAASAGGPDAGVVPAAEWPPKECDGVYTIVSHGPGGAKDPYMVPAGRETQDNIAWDPPWGNEQVQAIAFKTITNNAKVLHHWILYAQGAFITGWAPGEDGVRLMKPDVGMLLPGAAGSLTMNVHYYNTDSTVAERDNSGVEVCVVKRSKFRKNSAAVTMGLSNILNLSIPANASNYEIKGSCTVSGSQPITLLTASPHAHKLARRMVFTVTKKNGQKIVMHDEPFMFGDQKSFPLEPPLVVEAGDVINTSCFFTNDTGRTVTFGENTGNEMCFNFATYYPAGALNCGLGGILGGLGGLGGTF